MCCSHLSFLGFFIFRVIFIFICLNLWILFIIGSSSFFGLSSLLRLYSTFVFILWVVLTFWAVFIYKTPPHIWGCLHLYFNLFFGVIFIFGSSLFLWHICFGVQQNVPMSKWLRPIGHIFLKHFL